ncbi:uncharacterized protein EV420DRAFT_1650379 [Desarmillaria tabescens]|uniref:Uncharacterized protein n=1 Tax=Armillaria tabescens TaxID=1929756 RepID=A0AA39MPD8_ARMTA|nr:uncharacterized protein EV420DRAFT_1650379 [Desarmillaria tabescens]KAK0440885.1 hypothetical protein EV420DRAFT_1650379 [Desarmillaria tabescens]
MALGTVNITTLRNATEPEHLATFSTVVTGENGRMEHGIRSIYVPSSCFGFQTDTCAIEPIHYSIFARVAVVSECILAIAVLFPSFNMLYNTTDVDVDVA